MKAPIDRASGRVALLAAHCAGMIDLAALPLWMEVLITDYRLGPERSGMLVSMFLVAAVASTLLVAPRVGRILGSRVTFAGFAVAALAFGFSATTTDFSRLIACYLAGGAGVGCGLSVTHGAIGRSRNAHRLFAFAGAAFGVFAIGFYSIAPYLTGRFGGAGLFWLFSAVMATAALLCLLAFPSPVPTPASAAGRRPPLQPAVWFAIVGVSFMTLTQAPIASFLQHIGLERGFGAGRVNAVLVGSAMVTLLPAPLAALLQGRLPARAVVLFGPLAQVAVALAVTQHTPFWAYAVGGGLLTSVQIFTHTYAFGLIARMDGTGRATAATPAMLMTGAALGPFVAGMLVSSYGSTSLGWASAVFGVASVACFVWATRSSGPVRGAVPIGSHG